MLLMVWRRVYSRTFAGGEVSRGLQATDGVGVAHNHDVRQIDPGRGEDVPEGQLTGERRCLEGGSGHGVNIAAPPDASPAAAFKKRVGDDSPN